MKDYYSRYKLTPDYKDVETLKKFITPRGKIVAAEKSGLSAKHQRDLTRQVKHARYLGLLAYTSYQTEKLKHRSS